MMTDIKSMTLEEITAWLKEMGEPAFRGKQVFTWLHKGVKSFDEMTNLSGALRLIEAVLMAFVIAAGYLLGSWLLGGAV